MDTHENDPKEVSFMGLSAVERDSTNAERVFRAPKKDDVFFAIKGFILITIVSNIELGVAMKIMEAFLTTLSKLSEAFIFSDNFSSG